MLRMSEYLSACLASCGKSSPIRIPSTLVSMGLVQRPAIVGTGVGLGIEGVDVGRSAPQPDLDDRLGLGGTGLPGRRWRWKP